MSGECYVYEEEEQWDRRSTGLISLQHLEGMSAQGWAGAPGLNGEGLMPLAV